MLSKTFCRILKAYRALQLQQGSFETFAFEIFGGTHRSVYVTYLEMNLNRTKPDFFAEDQSGLLPSEVNPP